MMRGFTKFGQLRRFPTDRLKMMMLVDVGDKKAEP
jgi:hypothetical protein